MSTGEQTRPFGPVMMLVVGFDRSHFKGEILPELRRLSDEGIIRLLDLMVVAKHENGDLEALQESDLTTEQAQELGAIIGALVGFGHGGEEEAYSAAVAGAAEGEDGHILPDAEVWYLATRFRRERRRRSHSSSTGGRSRCGTRSTPRAASRLPPSGSIRPTWSRSG